MAAPSAQIDKGELKKLLIKSKKEPVNCAVATDKEGAVLIMLHKIKQPRALLKDLEKEYGDIRNPRFGSAFVDVDDNPKLVILTLNKAAPGIARKMKKTLKGTGFSKVRVMLEDGSIDEAVEEEEEGDENEAEAGGHLASDEPQDATRDAETTQQGPQAAQPQAGSDATSQGTAPETANAAQPDVAARQQPALDLAGLTRRLTDLVKRMVGVVKTDPSRQAALKDLAVQAQSALRAQDPDAESKIDAFEVALSADAAPSADGGVGNGKAPNMASFTKARHIWVATRQKVQGEVDKLLAEMSSVYKDQGFGAEADKVIRTKIEPVLEQLDESLAHKLDEVTGNTDQAQHAKLVQEARQIIDRYEAYLAGEPMIAKLDANPFVPLQIEKTLTATLAALSKAIV